MPIRNKLLLIFIFLFTGVLFFPSLQVLNFIITALLILVALFFNSRKEKLQLFKQRPILIWMLAFFTLIIISVLLSSDKRIAFRHLDPRLPLLYFPLSIGLIRVEKALFNKTLLGIAIIITIACLACLGYGIYRSITFHDTAYLYNDALSEGVTGQQSIYISLLASFAIYIFTRFLFFQPHSGYKLLLAFSILLLFIVNFLLASRSIMVVLYASAAGFALFNIFKRKKILEGITLIMGLLIGVFLVAKFFPKTLNRFKELAYTKFDYQQTGPGSHYNMPVDTNQWNGVNTRLAIWQCGWQLFKQHPFFGVHIGDKKAKSMEIYREKSFQFAIKTEKNFHNNYLDILVGMGITGLVFFLISWILLPVRIAWHCNDWLFLLVIITFAVAMITESYFDRSLGGMLFGFFISFFLTDKPVKN